MISEEAGWARARERGDRFVWAVDPLDGSVNYLRDYPHCAVSIALLDNGAPVLGVVDCFVLSERFTGIVGEGAWLNGAPMRVSDIADPAGGILQTGVPSRASAEFDGAVRGAAADVAQGAHDRLGGDGAGLCRRRARRGLPRIRLDDLGCGAGCALVKAAGGEFRIDGDRLDQPLEVAAGNAQVAASGLRSRSQIL